MNTLVKEHCVVCNENSPRVTEQEMKELMPLIPEWKVVEREGEKRIERIYKFKDFAGALAFTDRVGALAQAEDHHPALLTEYGKTTVTWWTHKIKGLNRNDLIMAAKSDELYQPQTA
jgi:4a-hydroxytetrahydrobiopterin dehydratase